MFKITIEHTTTIRKETPRKWVQINDGPEGKYGYAPAIQEDVESTVTVYTQTLPEIDLRAVINAVNGLKH